MALSFNDVDVLFTRWLNLEPDSDFVIADDVAEWTVFENRIQLAARFELMDAICKSEYVGICAAQRAY